MSYFLCSQWRCWSLSHRGSFYISQVHPSLSHCITQLVPPLLLPEVITLCTADLWLYGRFTFCRTFIQVWMTIIFFILILFNVIFYRKGTFKSTVYWRLPYYTGLPCFFYLDFLVLFYLRLLVTLPFVTSHFASACFMSY